MSCVAISAGMVTSKVNRTIESGDIFSPSKQFSGLRTKKTFRSKKKELYEFQGCCLLCPVKLIAQKQFLYPWLAGRHCAVRFSWRWGFVMLPAFQPLRQDYFPRCYQMVKWHRRFEVGLSFCAARSTCRRFRQNFAGSRCFPVLGAFSIFSARASIGTAKSWSVKAIHKTNINHLLISFCENVHFIVCHSPVFRHKIPVVLNSTDYI